MVSAGPAVVLIGPPGAGKSTVGAAVAELTGLVLLDTDALVEQRAGTTISELFVAGGEAGFRLLEREAVVHAVATHGGVLALGGGAVLDPATQADLQGRPVVYLRVSLRDAARRAGFDQGRPLLALNPRGQWLALMEKRRPTYERLARLEVDTDGRGPAAVAEDVVVGLGLPRVGASAPQGRSGDADRQAPDA